MPSSDDNLVNSPTIIAQRDDGIMHRRPRGESPPSGRRPAPADKPAASGGSGHLAVAILGLILALAAGGGAGFLYLEGEKLRAALAQSNQRIADLEGRLSSTGDSMSQSAEAQAVKIKELYSEIDKLWASAWRKNKERLDSMEASQKKAGDTLGTVDKQLKTTTSDVAALKKQSDAMKQQMAAAQELSITLATLKEQITQQGNTVAKVNSIATTMSSEQKALDARVRQTEDWVQSNIEFRKQVNSRLTQLENPAGSLPVQ